MRAITIRTLITLGISLGLVALISGPAGADDTDLFRQNFGKPYLFIFFDTSSSMNTSPPDQVSVPANADDPASTFYQAKRVFYEVFHDVYLQHGDQVHYGFASYNQDEARITGKHWVYQVTGGAVDIGGTPYPALDELLVFGAHFPAGTLGREPDFSGGGNEGPDQGDPNDLSATADGVLGDCANPADLGTQREHINRFAKLHPIAADLDDPSAGVGGTSPTTLHIANGGNTYQLVVSQVAPTLVSDPTMTVNFELTPCPDSGGVSDSGQITFTKVREFFYHEQVDDTQFGLHGSAATHEMTNGFWEYQAVESAATCGGNHPFAGVGWESNYDGYFDGDSGNPDPANPIQPPVGEEDSFGSVLCDTDPMTRKVECNTKRDTFVYDSSGEICFDPVAPEWRARDQGDMIAFDWDASNREAFFKRLAPNWTEGAPLANLRFDTASYFTDVPASDGFLRLKNPGIKPLLPFGGSPIGDSLVDWRCFYLGTDAGGNKCRQSDQPFGGGWDDLAAQCDSEFGCRKVYQIIIGDGENNCSGENPAADTANLRRNRIQSWVINFGGPQNSDLRRLAQNTGGEYIEVDDDQALKDELERIAGIILEDVRQFATAGAPRVQSDDLDKIFSGTFQPVNDASVGVWPGKLDAFLKPVPLQQDGTPDTDFACSNDPTQAPRANCHLWEAGEELLQQVRPVSNQFGTSADQRRVFYSRFGPVGQGVANRRFLAPTQPADGDPIRYDLWRGMGLIPSTMPDGGDPANELTHEANANDALATLYSIKTSDAGSPGDTSDDFDYVLGDIFHSDPLVVDQPEGSNFFRRDLFADADAVDCENNPGYRCFFLKHQNRRKVMFFGTNDGLVRGVDAGIPREGDPWDNRYDDGSGHELFAYSPRQVLPTVYSQNSGGPRQWSVDASPNASDVFIDPLDDGGLYPDPAQREWRTVLVGGFRRGGRGYYALDVTQPDVYDDDTRLPEPLGGGDEYVPSCIDAPVNDPDCGTVPYATPLWEFTDTWFEATNDPMVEPDLAIPFDQDGNGVPDLATSWSDPVLGLMRVCTGGNCNPDADPNDVEIRSVAVFGGGLNTQGNAGNWLYIVDVETGLAIYKQPLCQGGTGRGGVACETAGSAPAEPAVVDTDGDGFTDRIYIGTRRGYMLRADLEDASGNVPQLTMFVATTIDPAVTPMVDRITGDDFAPREIFRAAAANTAPAPSRQIFFRPAAGFLSDLGQYAIAFGTGNREDLFTSDNQPGRFYVFRDDILVGDFATRYSEDDLGVVVDGDPSVGGDALTENSATQGWLLLTRPDDRLIATPFQIAGITVFTMFEPDIIQTGGEGPGGGNQEDPVCSRTGTSRVFAVNTRNSDGLLFNAGVQTRGLDIAGFVVNPSLERASTQNIFDPTDPTSGSTRPDDPDDPDDDQFLVTCEEDPDCLLALAEMQRLQPDTCKYGAHRHNLPLTTDLLVKVGEIPIPICIIDKNWVEL